jgi:isoquinoline 1-oxidoreductase subunit alpha
VTSLTVNNQAVRYRMDPATPLLWALRDASNLTGTKYGCGTGDCGACTVDIDGRAVMSCMVTLAQVEGAFVTTIEALSRDRSHPVQQAWVAEQVPQCGFCQPGMIMAVAALIKAKPNPTYNRVRRAIRRAARAAAGVETIVAAPPPGIDPADAARAVPALTPPPR